MADASNKLFDAFREDHAVLGRSFHDIATCLRSGDIAGARTAAHRADAEAGAHIVFEEEHFYPALARFLDRAEIDAMYEEHEVGRSVITALATLADDARPSDAERRSLLDRAETMAHHIAECGTLFGAMGGLTTDEQSALYDALLALRRQAPRWSDYRRP
jgi:hypothetical protein